MNNHTSHIACTKKSQKRSTANIMSTSAQCAKCSTANTQLSQCSRCKSAKYCVRLPPVIISPSFSFIIVKSAECQRTDWPSHKRQCKPPSIGGIVIGCNDDRGEGIFRTIDL